MLHGYSISAICCPSYALAIATQATNRDLGLDFRGFAPETLERFQAYAWPGNVRELQSAIKQAMLNASGHLVLPEFLPESLALKPEIDQHSSEAASRLGAGFNLRALIEELLARGENGIHEKISAAIERMLLPLVLQHAHGHQSQASEILGLNRATLRHKLRSLGLAVDKTVTEENPERD